MKNIIYIFNSLIYSIGQISLGLFLHTYQTMQSLIKDQVFVWMALLPTLFLALVTIIWKFALTPLVRMVFSCQGSGFFACSYLPFFGNWLSFFCIYWQLMLLYLLYRFHRVGKK